MSLQYMIDAKVSSLAVLNDKDPCVFFEWELPSYSAYYKERTE